VQRLEPGQNRKVAALMVSGRSRVFSGFFFTALGKFSRDRGLSKRGQPVKYADDRDPYAVVVWCWCYLDCRGIVSHPSRWLAGAGRAL